MSSHSTRKSSKPFYFHHDFNQKIPYALTLSSVYTSLGICILNHKNKSCIERLRSIFFRFMFFKILDKNVYFRKLQNIGEAISRNMLVSGRSLMICNLKCLRQLHMLHEMLSAWHFYADGMIFITPRKLCVLCFLRNTSRLNWKRNLSVKCHAVCM